ncbi:MAG: hypothetical protein V7K41_29790 [Nostoc sp.]
MPKEGSRKSKNLSHLHLCDLNDRFLSGHGINWRSQIIPKA